MLRGRKSRHNLTRIWNCPRLFISFWLTFFLFYLSCLFEILRCHFPTVISQLTPYLILSYAPSLTHLIRFSRSLFLSPPSTPHSVFITSVLYKKEFDLYDQHHWINTFELILLLTQGLLTIIVKYHFQLAHSSSLSNIIHFIFKKKFRQNGQLK